MMCFVDEDPAIALMPISWKFDEFVLSFEGEGLCSAASICAGVTLSFTCAVMRVTVG